MLKERFFDPIHGFIHVSCEEKQLCDHVVFMRLHYLHQLGLTYLVYPGATHTRFEHSLGVMHVASKIYDQLFLEPDPYYQQALRIAALCHDLGHLPFSHTLEMELLGPHGHEKKTLELIQWLARGPIFQQFETLYPGFTNCVMKIALSPQVYLDSFPSESYSPLEKLLASCISGDYFGADRIDYLIRDSHLTGVSLGLFDYPQLIEMLALTTYEQAPVIALKEEGLHAAEGLLLARHYMHARVYKHGAVLGYNEALSRYVKKTCQIDFKALAPQEYVRYSDAWLTESFWQASLDPDAIGHAEASLLVKKSLKAPAVETQHAKKALGHLLIMSKNKNIIPFSPREKEIALFEQI